MADVLKPQLYDISSGSPVNLPEDQIPQAVASGKFGFLKGAQIPVVHPGGDTGTIPAESAPDAFKNGFNYESSPDQLERIKTSETAGAGNAALAAAAGAARGVSFGLSDQLMTKMGSPETGNPLVRPQTLSDLQKYRPGWSMTGEVGGILGSTFLAPEAGLTGMVSRIGKGATEAAEIAGLKLTGAGMEAAGIGGSARAAKILAAANEIGAHAAGSAVEGALYGGIGNTISEDALGDPDLNAQKVLSNFGYGALLGGALGATIKGASIAIPESLNLAKQGFNSLRNTLIGTGEEDAGLLGRVLPDKISDALANRSVNLDTDQKMELINKTTDDLNTIHNNIQTTVKKLNSDIRPKETNALIDTADDTKVRYARQDIVNSMNKAIELMRSEPELYSGTAARKLEIQRDGIVNGMKHDDDPSTIFQSLKETKQKLKEMVFSKIPTSQEVESMNLINKIGSDINSKLKDPDIFGHVGSSYAAHDEMLSDYYKYISPKASKPTDFQKAFMAKSGQGPNTRWEFDPKKVERILKTQETVTGQQKLNLLDGYYTTLRKLPEHLENTYANVPNENFDPAKLNNIIDNSQKSNTEAAAKYLETVHNSKKSLGWGDFLAAHVAMSHPVVGAAIEAYNVVTKPIEHLNKLAEMERLIGKASNAIGKGAAAIFKPAIALSDMSRNVVTKLALEDRMDSHKKLVDTLTKFQHNPESLIDAISSNTEPISGAAPKTAQALQNASIQATQFLASKIPSPPNANQFSEPYQPSSTELATFERYLTVAEKPMTALDQVRNGTLTPETIETLTAIYPKLYDQMKQAIMQEATDQLASKTPIPYGIKQSISHFIGEPMDETMTPQSIMANQMSYAQDLQQSQNQQPMPHKRTKPSLTGMRKIDLASRTNVRSRNDEV